MMMKPRHALPLASFLALAGLLGTQLGKAPAPLPSALLNRPAPSFSAPQLDRSQAAFSPQSMRGQVWLLNVWASWCTSCRDEHPLLLDIGQRHGIPIVGLHYEDEARQGTAWLASQGNPYTSTPQDQNGQIGMALGVYGVPETFIIDKQGVIRMRHAGPLTPAAWQGTILPLIKALQHG